MSVLYLFFNLVKVFQIVLFFESGALEIARNFTLATLKLLVEAPLLVFDFTQQVRALVCHLAKFGLEFACAVLPFL